MIFDLFKVKTEKKVPRKILKYSNIEKNKKKNFGKHIQEIMNNFHVDELQEIGADFIFNTHKQINASFGAIAGNWWETNRMLLGDEIKKKTVWEMYLTLKIFFKTQLDQRLNKKEFIENTFKALMCNIAITASKNAELRRELNLK